MDEGVNDVSSHEVKLKEESKVRTAMAMKPSNDAMILTKMQMITWIE